jgi:hypothetical protein
MKTERKRNTHFLHIQYMQVEKLKSKILSHSHFIFGVLGPLQNSKYGL